MEVSIRRVLRTEAQRHRGTSYSRLAHGLRTILVQDHRPAEVGVLLCIVYRISASESVV